MYIFKNHCCISWNRHSCVLALMAKGTTLTIVFIRTFNPQALSAKYYETRFAKINVEKAKFFVEKLKVRILPAIFCFIKGIVSDKLVLINNLHKVIIVIIALQFIDCMIY